MDDSVWPVVVGGAVGSLLAAVGWLAVRLAAVPRDLSVNTATVATINRRLEVWTILEARRLRSRIYAINAEQASRGVAGAAVEQARAKESSLEAFSDRWIDAQREHAAIVASERWVHSLIRWAWRRELQLTVLVDVKPILDDWRKPAVGSGGNETQVLDPMSASVEDALSG